MTMPGNQPLVGVISDRRMVDIHPYSVEFEVH